MKYKISIIALLAIAYLLCPTNISSQVKVYEGKETIPTYQPGPNEPSPLFYTGRNVQGAAGHIYPYPAQITLADTLTNVTYDMVYLENEYLKVSILPALGGKLFSAIDKTNGHELFHRNTTVKPDLIGTLGAWISGGIEWCYPHHHRTTTFLPSDFIIEKNEDGSATVWVGETEKSLHLRGVIGITLHPGRSYIDVVYRLNNPNPVMRNFKFWANVAVTADSNFRTFFPPSQEIGVFHGNSSFTHWPISHEVYNGTDYTAGVDMTWYKNHPSPTSVFFWEGEEGFVGGYDYAQKAGVVHVGDKYINRASKLWEWGPGLEGENARRKLTDDGRDYVELMTGTYSNNQPDYSWFAPLTVKEAQNFWYPIRDLEIVKNATLDVSVTLQMRNSKTVFFGFNTTRKFSNAKVILMFEGKNVFEKTIEIDPSKPYTATWKSKSEIDEYELNLLLLDEHGQTLVSYKPYKPKNPELPPVMEPVKLPSEIESVEDLYLTGRYVEQFSQPYRDAEDYYQEALRRSPNDYRVNMAMGIRRINQRRFREAENYLQIAADKLKTRYIQPLEGDLFYYSGLAQRAQGKYDEAYRNFNKAAFYYAWFSQSHFQLAQMESEKGNYKKAVEYISNAYSTNNNEGSILLLYSALLRRLNLTEEALVRINHLVDYDPLNFAAVYERDLLQKTNVLEGLHRNMQDVENNYLEIAVIYLNAGMYEEAATLLAQIKDPKSPLTPYYLSYIHGKFGNRDKAVQYAGTGNHLSLKYCFPYRIEDEYVLKHVISLDSSNSVPWYLLGNLLYDYRPDEAVKAWITASKTGNGTPVIWRNLAFGAFYHQKKVEQAIDYQKKAIAGDPANPVWYAELVDYYDCADRNVEECITIMENNIEQVKKNVTAPQSLIRLYNLTGNYDKAIDLLKKHHFRTWEGERDIYRHFADAHVLKAQQYLKEKNFQSALAELDVALTYPPNLEVGKSLDDERNAHIFYMMAEVFADFGDKTKAKDYYVKCTLAKNANNQPDLLYYQGVAYQKLGDRLKSEELFRELFNKGKEMILNSEEMPQKDDLNSTITKRNLLAEGLFLQALGILGLGNQGEAVNMLKKSVEVHHYSLWPKNFLWQLQSGNPVFDGWYADPEGVIFGNEYWIYPTYSAPYHEQVFMDAFSSEDLAVWTKHERIIDTGAVKWARYAMWAPAIVKKDNRYFLFFAANDIQRDGEKGGIGIGVSDKPEGPFKDYLGKPLLDKFHNGAQPIDQFIFKDKDSQYYMIYGGWRHCNIVRLREDFTGFLPFDDGSTFKEITPEGYVEGPFMFIRNNKYYFMWSEGSWGGSDYRVAYAIADSPLGPFKRLNTVLEQDPEIGKGAGHHSVIRIPGTDEWYIIYHRRPLDRTDANHRVTCIDRMHFDENGLIKPVKITHEGVEPRLIR